MTLVVQKTLLHRDRNIHINPPALDSHSSKSATVAKGGASSSSHSVTMTKRVIVIGAGTAGLSAIKNALAEGFQVTAYEQWEKLGGLWNYTDKKGVNEHGLPYPYMYRDLRSNGPKETMHFTDFEMISDKSFVSSQEVVKYLNDYTDNFQLRNVIKFQHQVIRVLPIEGERWEVLVKDLATGTYSTETADFVMVCNGHHSRPDWPKIPGQNLFPIEEQRHSCDFRAKEEYTGGKRNYLFCFT